MTHMIERYVQPLTNQSRSFYAATTRAGLLRRAAKAVYHQLRGDAYYPRGYEVTSLDEVRGVVSFRTRRMCRGDTHVLFSVDLTSMTVVQTNPDGKSFTL